MSAKENTEETFEPSDLVWAKMRGYPQWPARVVCKPSGQSKPSSNHHYVFFYGTHDVAWMSAKDLLPFKKYHEKFRRSCQRQRPGLSEAVWEIEEDPELLLSEHRLTLKQLLKGAGKKRKSKSQTKEPKKLADTQDENTTPTPTPILESQSDSSTNRRRSARLNTSSQPTPSPSTTPILMSPSLSTSLTVNTSAVNNNSIPSTPTVKPNNSIPSTPTIKPSPKLTTRKSKASPGNITQVHTYSTRKNKSTHVEINTKKVDVREESMTEESLINETVKTLDETVITPNDTIDAYSNIFETPLDAKETISSNTIETLTKTSNEATMNTPSAVSSCEEMEPTTSKTTETTGEMIENICKPMETSIDTITSESIETSSETMQDHIILHTTRKTYETITDETARLASESMEDTDETSKNTGDTTENTGDTTKNTGDTTKNTHSGDTTESTLDTTKNTGDTTENTGDTTKNTGDTTGKTFDTTKNTGDTTENTGEILENNSEIMENTDETSGNIGETTKTISQAIEVIGNQIETIDQTTELTTCETMELTSEVIEMSIEPIIKEMIETTVKTIEDMIIDSEEATIETTATCFSRTEKEEVLVDNTVEEALVTDTAEETLVTDTVEEALVTDTVEATLVNDTMEVNEEIVVTINEATGIVVNGDDTLETDDDDSVNIRVVNGPVEETNNTTLEIVNNETVEESVPILIQVNNVIDLSHEKSQLNEVIIQDTITDSISSPLPLTVETSDQNELQSTSCKESGNNDQSNESTMKESMEVVPGINTNDDKLTVPDINGDVYIPIDSSSNGTVVKTTTATKPQQKKGKAPPQKQISQSMSKVDALKIYNYNLKVSLIVDLTEPQKALKNLRGLMDLEFSASEVTQVKDLVYTLRKVRMFKGSSRVRNRANEVYSKIKGLYVNDTRQKKATPATDENSCLEENTVLPKKRKVVDDVDLQTKYSKTAVTEDNTNDETSACRRSRRSALRGRVNYTELSCGQGGHASEEEEQTVPEL